MEDQRPTSTLTDAENLELGSDDSSEEYYSELDFSSDGEGHENEDVDALVARIQGYPKAQKESMKRPLAQLAFGPDMVTLKVGPERESMTVHAELVRLLLASKTIDADQKAQLARGSPVLSAMFNSGFSETTNKVAELPEDSPNAVRRMISFLYGDNSHVACTDLPSDEVPDMLAEIYGLADQYQIPALQRLALRILWRYRDFRTDAMLFFRVCAKILRVNLGQDKVLLKLFAIHGLEKIKDIPIDQTTKLWETVREEGEPFAGSVWILQAVALSKASVDRAHFDRPESKENDAEWVNKLDGLAVNRVVDMLEERWSA